MAEQTAMDKALGARVDSLRDLASEALTSLITLCSALGCTEGDVERIMHDCLADAAVKVVDGALVVEGVANGRQMTEAVAGLGMLALFRTDFNSRRGK